MTKLGSGSLTVNGKELPDYAEVIGYIIEFMPISIVIGCAIYQIIVYGKDGRLVNEYLINYYFNSIY